MGLISTGRSCIRTEGAWSMVKSEGERKERVYIGEGMERRRKDART